MWDLFESKKKEEGKEMETEIQNQKFGWQILYAILRQGLQYPKNYFSIIRIFH